MLTYDLDRRGTIPRYDYLCRCIRDDILCGRLTAGSRLPSRRSLAEHLKVSAVTVESAYAQLAAEGYIVSREKSGYFVSQLEPALRPPSPPPIRTDAPPPGQPWMMDLRGGGGSTELFPFSVWAKLMRQVLSQRGPDPLRPVPHSGVPELREAIAGTLYRLRGLSVSPEQIVVGSGSEYLYNLIVQLLGRKLVYGVEDPGYPKPARIYALNGARCISLPVDGQGISPQTLAASPAQVVHLSPSHQFPTGAVTPAGRRQALLRWAAQGGDRYLIEDDYDSEFRFTGLPIPALQSIDQADRVIYLNTFSRALAPSLRISYLVLPPTLLDRYHQRLGFYSSTVPALEQYTLASFLFTGDMEKKAENDLISAGADLSADVLKVGHHGASTSSTAGFLEEVNPVCSVISVGEGNSYGHPTAPTLERLTEYGPVYRTDLLGEIRISTDGVSLWVESDNGEREQLL